MKIEQTEQSTAQHSRIGHSRTGIIRTHQKKVESCMQGIDSNITANTSGSDARLVLIEM